MKGLVTLRLVTALPQPVRTFPLSSAGPTLPLGDQGQREKPELLAPDNLLILPAFSNNVTTATGNSAFGTSVSAAVVTGVVALLFARAQKLQPERSLTIDETRRILINAAMTRRDEVTGDQWNKRLGHGRISAPAILKIIS